MNDPFGQRLGRHRYGVQLGVDMVAWAIGMLAALLLRYDLAPGRGELEDLALFLPLALVLQAVVGELIGLYRGQWRFGSFDEIAALTGSTLAVTAAATAFNGLLDDRPLPLSVPAIGGCVALVLMLGSRYAWRLALERSTQPSETAERLLVFGAGEGGAQTIQALRRDRDAPYVPCALLDDDPGKRHLRISGVRVVGDRRHLVAAARDFGATAVVIAIPSADAPLVREITELATKTGLKTLVVPSTRELFGQAVGVADMRPPTEADLLGRRELDTDVTSIAGYLTGKRVLVTGAGGSIGSELCRQIARFGPTELMMLDRDESALHAVQLSIEGRALLDQPNTLVADIRDRVRMRELFAERRPEVVFHAAALKHLPLLEMHPEEGVKTNVYGTQHLLDVAMAYDVERFVNISTDKAADPCSVLGYTKRVAERLTAEMARRASSGTYLSVRFGNVLGSRGSVLTTFRAQAAAGGPITVTHPEVTRYFMTIEEAVQLVIQAGAIGRSGEALVLDMGEPVKIDDVARRFAATGERVEIVYTGLRPGEKLHEDLLGTGEADERPIHPLISHVDVPPLSPTELVSLGASSGRQVRMELAELCGVDELAAEKNRMRTTEQEQRIQ